MNPCVILYTKNNNLCENGLYRQTYFFAASHSATAVASAPLMRPFGIAPCPFAITFFFNLPCDSVAPMAVKLGPTPPFRSPP